MTAELAPGLDRGQSLVYQMHRQAESAGELSGEAPRPGCHRCLGVVHIERQADDRRGRTPLLNQALDAGPIRLVALAAQRAEGGRRPGDRLADGHPDLPRPEVKPEESAHLGVAGVAAQ